ncbi:hypothetical protein [Rhizobium leguminosarum]|uniref:hypothetical protein n=1 Tax=Rhizobium leguminosarum TaxID=384 RepID=UPI001C90F56C|nr:hypothetical protein [Rhizobium leguminosarum]MBY3043708.1 hypothetical protein [Rhizobium leguminosarum]
MDRLSEFVFVYDLFSEKLLGDVLAIAVEVEAAHEVLHFEVKRFQVRPDLLRDRIRTCR